MRTLPHWQTVGSFLADNVSDVDNNALQGVAITSVDGNGTWQYQLNGQETWQDVSEVSNTSALLLGTTDLIRYVPDGENGETATFTYQAWDQTTGGAGTYADASAGGGTSAFSSATDTASLTVGDVNVAPVLTPTTPTLTGTDEDTTSTGQTVGSFLADNVSDVDNNALQGVAITSVDGNGTWQYQLNGQETWQDVSEVSNTSALLLGTTDLSAMCRMGRTARPPPLPIRLGIRPPAALAPMPMRVPAAAPVPSAAPPTPPHLLSAMSMTRRRTRCLTAR